MVRVTDIATTNTRAPDEAKQSREYNLQEVSSSKRARLWLPLDKIVHENAIIGEIKDGDNYYVRVIARDSELDGDPGAATEGKLNYEKRNKSFILS